VFKTLKQIEHEYILYVLTELNGNRTATAEALGVSLSFVKYSIRLLRKTGAKIPPPIKGLSLCDLNQEKKL